VIWSGRQPHITSLHVVMGAFTLAISVVLTLSTRALAWRKTSEVSRSSSVPRSSSGALRASAEEPRNPRNPEELTEVPA
jgi:hypothetical protein